MKAPSKTLQRIAFDTRLQVEEHLLIGMDKNTHEERLSQPKQTNKKKFKNL